MRLNAFIAAGIAAFALQLGAASAAPVNPANGPAVTNDAVVLVHQHHHRKMRRGCRFDHGRLICGPRRHHDSGRRHGRHGDRHRGDGHGSRH